MKERLMPYKPSKSPLLSMWKKFGNSGLGRWLVSRGVCFTAPYFRTISPQFVDVQAGRVEVVFKKRWGVTNHIKTVHAIAMCNAAELAGGACLDVSLDSSYCWIPVGMTVEYLKMAKTNLRAVCEYPDYASITEGDVLMPVSVFDANDVEVFHADISMRVSAKKK